MRFATLFMRGAGLSGALMLVAVPSALGDLGENTPLHVSAQGATHVAAASGSGSSIVRTLIALVVVIVIIYGIARVLRMVKGRPARSTGDGLERLATLPLGVTRSVALVRAGREVHLIGISEHGVSSLRTYTEAEALESGIPALTVAAEVEGRTALSGPIAPAPAADARPSGSLVAQLKRMTIRS